MDQRLEGMADIIPPTPTHDGLAALLAPGSSAPGWWLFALFVASLLLAAFLLRRRLLARWHLWNAERTLRSSRPAPEIASRIERSLRQYHRISILHPERAPCGVDATAWRSLIERLHAAKFSTHAKTQTRAQTMDLSVIRSALAACYLSSKSHAGRAAVGCAVRTDHTDEGAHGAPYTSPPDNAQTSHPRKSQGRQP